MLIVKFGQAGGFFRVGIVIGSYTELGTGEILCVKTPFNAVSGQRFDPVPKDRAQEATIEELRECIERERSEAEKRLNAYVTILQPA